MRTFLISMADFLSTSSLLSSSFSLVCRSTFCSSEHLVQVFSRYFCSHTFPVSLAAAISAPFFLFYLLMLFFLAPFLGFIHVVTASCIFWLFVFCCSIFKFFLFFAAPISSLASLFCGKLFAGVVSFSPVSSTILFSKVFLSVVKDSVVLVTKTITVVW